MAVYAPHHFRYEASSRHAVRSSDPDSNQTRNTTQSQWVWKKAFVQTGDAIHKQFIKIVSSIHGLDCQAHSVFDHSDSRIAGSKQAMSVLLPKTLCQMSTVFQCSDSSKQMTKTKNETHEVGCAWRRVERKITGRRLKRISRSWRTCRIERRFVMEIWVVE